VRQKGKKQMTQLLEKAFEEASRLPEIEQNAFAKWVLEELRSEKKWMKAFADSEDVLESLADEAIKEKRKGKNTPLDFDRL
jgi:hypothetical protein